MTLNLPTRISFLLGLGLAAFGCQTDPDARDGLDMSADSDGEDEGDDNRLSFSQTVERADAIKAAHAGHAFIDNPVLFAGIASAETGLAHCHNEYVGQKCPGEYTAAACGGGVILAGGWDGTCAQGGLGMFQFDEGTQSQTYNHWLFTGKWPIGAGTSRNVATLDGNIAASIDFVLYKAWISDATPFFPDHQAMYDWINGIRPVDGDPDFELWLGFLSYNYNGQAWGTAAWANTKNKYRNHTLALYADLGGDAYWYSDSPPPPPAGGCSPEGGTWCGGNGVGGDPNILYTCDDGNMVVQQVCANGCFAAPPGSPDSCNQPNPADTDCSCANGLYHNGDPIAPGDTYCGMRVCGTDGNLYECDTSNAWKTTGQTCGTGACSCEGGMLVDGTPIAIEHTECGFEACGGGNTWYTCGPAGWSAIEDSYCTLGGSTGGPSCAGQCGQNAGGCWCDSLCENYGDCCEDKVAHCG